MTTVADVTAWLEQFAPARLAEPWDNVGLLWGDPTAPAERVMTCLTVTPATAAEAIREHAGLIVSHHPVLFREVKKIRADLPETGYLWKLARAGIAIASPHTAFDNTHEGINDILCRRLGLVDVAPLRPWRRSRAAGGRPRSRSRSSSSRPRPSARRSRRRHSRPAPAASAPTRNARSRSPAKVLFSEPTGQPDRWRARTPRDGPRAEAGVRLPGADARRGARDDPRSPFVRRARDRRLSPPREPRSRHATRPEPAASARHGEGPRPGGICPARRPRARARSRGDGGRPAPAGPRVAVACGAGDDFLKDAARPGPTCC